MKKDYPFISEIEVTSDRDMHSHYIDKERNMIYNIWFKLNDWGDFDNWKEFEDFVIRVKNSFGLNGRIRFYYLDADSEDSHFDD